MAYKKLK